MIVRSVDIGGNGVRPADVEVSGKAVNIIRRLERGHPFSQGELLDVVLKDLLPETRTIAYCAAGVIERSDRIVNSPNAHWLNGMELATETRRRSGKPAKVFNDMEGAVTGMAALLPDAPFFMGITWSSGIGLRIWRDGRLLSHVCEGGHMVVDISPTAPLCGCGRRGHAEAIAGGEAVKRQVLDVTSARKIEIPEEVHPTQFLNDCFRRREEWAVMLYSAVARGMGVLLANVVSFIPVPAIVWKGTFAGKGGLDLVEGLIRRTMREVMIEPKWAAPGRLKFIKSPGEPDDDSLIGAARLISERRAPLWRD
jgi:predicted NBD/HSP70 family sugar kinase